MAEIGHLKAALSANHASFDRDMGRARASVLKNANGMQAAMLKTKFAFEDASKALNKFGGYAVASAIAAGVAFVKQQINIADEMGKLAQKTGTTSEFLSGMGLVASQTGTTLETIGKSIQKLSRNMADARAGTGDAKDAFADLGINVTESNGTLRNAENVLKDLATKFAGLEDGADKTALAIKIFGKSGSDLIPTLNLGAAGIEDLQRKAQEMGLVISTKTALEAEFLNDQLDLMKNSAIGAGRGIALSLVPWLNDAIAAIKLAKEESGTLMAAWVALGAIGDAAFSKPLQTQIEETKRKIENLTKAQAEYDAAPIAGRLKNLGFAKDYKERIIALTAELKKLEKQEQDEANAQDERMRAALKKQEAEAEARLKNTEEMIRQSEARLKAEQFSRQAEAEAKNAARLAAAEAKKAAELLVNIENQRQDSIADTITALEKELYTIGLTRDQLVDFELSLLGATKAQREHAIQLAKDSEAKSQAIQLTNKYKSSIQAVEERLVQLNDLYNKGLISQEIFSREAADAWEKIGNKGKSELSDLQQAIEGWGKQSAKSLADFAMSGKASFSDMARSIINDMIQMMIYQNLMGPLFSGISSAVGGGTFSSGWSSFGGGKAHGGPVSAGKFYEVNERGPELLTMGNKQFLMMGQQSGSITPASGGSDGSVSVVVNVDAEGSSVQGDGDNAAALGRMMGSAVRGILIQEKRPGGLLA